MKGLCVTRLACVCSLYFGRNDMLRRGIRFMSHVYGGLSLGECVYDVSVSLYTIYFFLSFHPSLSVYLSVHLSVYLHALCLSIYTYVGVCIRAIMYICIIRLYMFMQR